MRRLGNSLYLWYNKNMGLCFYWCVVVRTSDYKFLTKKYFF